MRSTTAAITIFLAALISPACCFGQSIPSLKGIDVQQLLKMQARAEAARDGQGQVSKSDVSQALRIASQLGLSPKVLAAKIQARAGSHPALKGLSQEQLADQIRALAKKHGKSLKEAPAKKSSKQQAKKAAQTKHNSQVKYGIKMRRSGNPMSSANKRTRPGGAPARVRTKKAPAIKRANVVKKTTSKKPTSQRANASKKATSKKPTSKKPTSQKPTSQRANASKKAPGKKSNR